MINMRKIALILPVLAFLAARSYAQTAVEFIPTAGYTFSDRTDFYSAYGRIADGLNLGGSIKFNINRGIGIEFLYSHMNTTSGLYQYGNDLIPLSSGNLNLDYIVCWGPCNPSPFPIQR